MAKKILDENFLLNTHAAKQLNHGFAKDMPIIDYHSHLPPNQIAADFNFENLTRAWLYGDHYKWRAMLTNDVLESFCAGVQTDFEKFNKWAETVPYTLRNPLYHWTHLELQRYFGINEILNAGSAERIYEECSSRLQTHEYSVRNLLRNMNVKVVCTTKDPINTLEHHQKIKENVFEIKILPAFRPDKAMNVDDSDKFNEYIKKLEAVTNVSISGFNDYLYALENRHDFFDSAGCCISDHGLEEIYGDNFTGNEEESIFNKIRSGKELNYYDIRKFKSAMLLHFGRWNYDKGWVQPYHLGALRNNNTRMLKQLGVDTGWDSIDDFSQAKALAKFLNRLDQDNKLTKTILYNLNPNDNELMATLIGNFNGAPPSGF